MKENMRHLSAPLVFGALLVGFLVLVVRSGAMPVDAAPAVEAPGQGSPRLGETLQRAALITSTEPFTSYFPLVFKNRYIKIWFEPYDRWEHFNWPQTTDWQWGSVRNTVTVHEEFNYGQRKDPDDGAEVYFIAIRDNFDHVFLTGPTSVYAQGDFKYTVWMRRMSESADQLFEYGILISPTFIDAAHPDADDVYTFHIRLDYGGLWLVRKWDIYSLGSRHASTQAEGTSGKIIEVARWWNVFQIERTIDDAGVSTLHFRIANEKDDDDFDDVATITDDSMPWRMYVGFFASQPDRTTWREYQYDAIRIQAQP